MSRKYDVRILLLSILALTFLPFPILAQSPNVTSSVSYQGNCVWYVTLNATGFAPNSTMYNNNNGGSETDCSGQTKTGGGWSNWQVGSTDGNGNFSTTLIHGGYGTYNYELHDAQGNSASTVVSYGNEGAPPLPPTSIPPINNNPTFPAPTITPSDTTGNPDSATPSDLPDNVNPPINPTVAPTSIPDCSQSVGNDLVIGGYGRVRLDSTSANLRVSPSTSGSVIESLATGTTFTVTDGAVCSDNFWWWKIDVDGKSGWVAGQLLETVGSLTPTQVEQPQPTLAPLYADAQSGDGIHFGNYCQDKYQATEYREEGNARSWSCMTDGTRILLDLNQVCREVWGDARPYINVPNESDIRGLTCQAQPQSNTTEIKPTPTSTNPKQCYAAQEDRAPGDTTVLRGTVFTFHWRVRCDDGENNGLPRAVKIEIDGVSYAEIAANEQTYTWNTSNVSLGTHSVCFMGASHGDEGWQKAANSCWTYQIVDQLPQQPPTSAVTCPNTPTTQLSLGVIAVIATHNNQNVRSQAGLSYSVLYSLSPNTVFTIVSGPQCVDGYLWWEVGYNGQGGWVAEGKDSDYYIVPNTPNGIVNVPTSNVTQEALVDEIGIDSNVYGIYFGTISPTTQSYVQVPSSVNRLDLYSDAASDNVIGKVVGGYFYQLLEHNEDRLRIIVGGISGWVNLYSVTFQSFVTGTKIVRYINGWCSAIPIDVGFHGISREGHALPNPKDEMYFPPEVYLHSRNGILQEHYVYFNNNYLSEDIAGYPEWSQTLNVWVLGISSTWAGFHPSWAEDRNAWRLDYKCSS